MQIAVLTNEFEPVIIGGLGIVATQLSNALHARGHELLVITRGGGGSEVSDREQGGLRIIRFPSASEYHSRTQQRLYAGPVLHYLRRLRKRPDIIHVHSLQADELAIGMRDAFFAQIIYTCHSLVSKENQPKHPSPHMEIRQKRFMETADAIISPSNWQATVLLQQYPAALSKLYVVPNGVTPLSVFTLNGLRRKEQLLFAGRLVRQKGVAEAISAIADLKNMERRVRLDIIGKGTSNYVKYLQTLSRRLHVSSHVRFLGQCSHQTVLRRMQSAGAVIMPSRNESFGLVALEAMATGTPLVSTRAGGLRDFVDGDTAAIIESSTSDAISKAVAQVWLQKERTRKRQRAAFERSLHYTWDIVASQYEAVMDGTAVHYSPAQNE